MLIPFLFIPFYVAARAWCWWSDRQPAKTRNVGVLDANTRQKVDTSKEVKTVCTVTNLDEFRARRRSAR